MRRWIDSVRSISYIQELGIKVIIYTKGPETDLAALKDTTAADEVFQLPNVGREGGTYLHHLLKVYDDPPPFTIFTQAIIKKGQYLSGEVEDEHVAELKDWLYDKLSEKFTSDIGFMSLDRKHDICYCGHCTDMGRHDFYPLWPQLYAILEGTLCQELEGTYSHSMATSSCLGNVSTRVQDPSMSIYRSLLMRLRIIGYILNPSRNGLRKTKGRAPRMTPNLATLLSGYGMSFSTAATRRRW